MKKVIALAIVAIMVISGGLVAVHADNGNGNGAPSGKHYTLNILGKSWSKGETIPENHGHRIFVGYNKNGNKVSTRIHLQEGDFQVIDCDGTDGEATFQLPQPYDDGETEFDHPAYQVFIRVLSPKGHADMYTVVFNGTTWLPSSQIITLDQNGKKNFQDVTRQLTTVTADIDGDGNEETVGLFDEEWEGCLWAWDYDNYGLKHVQIRFYPVDYEE